MRVGSPRRLGRLGASIVVLAYLAGCSLPCGAASLAAPEPGAAAHGAHAETHSVAESDEPMLHAPCACGCQRHAGPSGLLGTPGPALLLAPWRLPNPCLKTRLGAARVGAPAEDGDALDHVPILHLL